MQLFWRLSVAVFLSVCKGYGQTHQGSLKPFVSSVTGKAFVVSKENPDLPPQKLDQNDSVLVQAPYSLVTSKDSFLEIKNLSPAQPYTMRIGQKTGVEFRRKSNFYMFQGSMLLAGLGEMSYSLESNGSKIQLNGSGTFIAEVIPVGFKILVLEGSFSTVSSVEDASMESGDLVLMSGENGKLSQKIKIELPLLLSTSRLVTHFPEPLITQSRLISAAQVQVLRMKSKYNAFIGGVSEDRQLRIWKVPSAQKADK
jgi:hypothetical protein